MYLNYRGNLLYILLISILINSFNFKTEVFASSSSSTITFSLGASDSTVIDKIPGNGADIGDGEGSGEQNQNVNGGNQNNNEVGGENDINLETNNGITNSDIDNNSNQSSEQKGNDLNENIDNTINTISGTNDTNARNNVVNNSRRITGTSQNIQSQNLDQEVDSKNDNDKRDTSKPQFGFSEKTVRTAGFLIIIIILLLLLLYIIKRIKDRKNREVDIKDI